jgi:DNA (cytosine-5)-methyltransferase 1
MNKLKFADLFCGCGGFSYGFNSKIGYQNILAVDSWDASVKVYSQNYPKNSPMTLDLSDLKSINYVTKILRENGCDVLVGGPPCQGFSTLGLRRHSDKRSELVEVFIEIAKKIQPSIILMENVRGILSMKHPKGGIYPERIRNILNPSSIKKWDCKDLLIDMQDFGLAQTRKRNLFIAVNRKKVDIEIFWKEFDINLNKFIKKSSQANLRDVIYDLPRIPMGEIGPDVVNLKGKKIYNHRAMKHSSELIARFKHVPPGGGLMDVPKRLLTDHLKRMVSGNYGSGGHVKNIYGRMEWDKPSGTIVAGIDKITCGRFVHPEDHRLLTPRECARIQSFPDDFVFEGSNVSQYYMIGNAVPPKFSEVLAKIVKNCLQDSVI